MQGPRGIDVLVHQIHYFLSSILLHYDLLMYFQVKKDFVFTVATDNLYKFEKYGNVSYF